jgi:hypothetical protein
MSGAGHDWDDDELLALLGDALREERDVPADFIESAKGLLTWHTIDAELAALTFDSQAATVGTRAEQATIRDLTFMTPTLTVQVQVAGSSLHGQVVPAQPGRVELHVQGGAPTVVTVDEQGWFTIEPVPRAEFRLLCRTATGASALTPWLTV